jgi:2-iminoacetate synthase ThiH
VETLKDRAALVEGEDFYREGDFVVFTARYHLRRGFCCESGCRHCPYRVDTKSRAEEFEREAEGET